MVFSKLFIETNFITTAAFVETSIALSLIPSSTICSATAIDMGLHRMVATKSTKFSSSS